MPTLSNPKRELFAQELAKGTSATKSYEIAGFKPDSGAASRYSKFPEIVQRVSELLSERKAIEISATTAAIESIGATKAYVMQGLIDNAEVALGRRTVKVMVRPRGTARAVEVEMHQRDPGAANRALELLGKELGMFIDRKEVRVGTLDDLDAGERDAIRDAIRGELARRIGGPGPAGQPEEDRALPPLH